MIKLHVIEIYIRKEDRSGRCKASILQINNTTCPKREVLLIEYYQACKILKEKLEVCAN